LSLNDTLDFNIQITTAGVSAVATFQAPQIPPHTNASTNVSLTNTADFTHHRPPIGLDGLALFDFVVITNSVVG
jgi:hypothetical protein